MRSEREGSRSADYPRPTGGDAVSEGAIVLSELSCSSFYHNSKRISTFAHLHGNVRDYMPQEGNPQIDTFQRSESINGTTNSMGEIIEYI